LDTTGQVLVHRNVPSTPAAFLEVVAPYRADLVVASECMFTWYWLADLCAAEGIAFVLGHALAMKAIHGGKAKNDKIDSHKIAVLLRGGMLPQAYVYPAAMRSTRDLLRRRLHLVRRRGELLAHIQNTRAQYNLPAFERRLAYASNREGVGEHCPDPSVRKSIEVDLALIDQYDALVTDLELTIVRGIGKVLALTSLYEIHDIDRFDRVQEFASYARLIKVHQDVGRQETWHERRQDGQRAFEVGVLRGRGDVSPPQPRGPEAPRPSRKEARQRQGPVDPRAQDRARGLLHAVAEHRLLDG
ncbi:MAG: transposase, partial [Acidobacteria bacterium]|nr:transposase [Acidobacteriota bacterium]